MDPIRIDSLHTVLSTQSANTKKILNSLATLEWIVLAQQAALYSLIATHPNPLALFEEFASYVDRAAPADGEEPNDQMREEMQKMQERIRQAASRQTI